MLAVNLAIRYLLSDPRQRLQGVDINTADAETLATAINGVGIKKASAIVAYRGQHGPFKSIDELTLVEGIGPGIVEKNRSNLTAKTAPNATE